MTIIAFPANETTTRESFEKQVVGMLQSIQQRLHSLCEEVAGATDKIAFYDANSFRFENLRLEARRLPRKIADLGKTMNIDDSDMEELMPAARQTSEAMVSAIDSATAAAERAKERLTSSYTVQQQRGGSGSSETAMGSWVVAIVVAVVLGIGAAALGLKPHPGISVSNSGHIRTHLNF